MRPTTSPMGLAALALVAGAGCTEREGGAPGGWLDPLDVPDEARPQLEEARARMVGAETMAIDPILDRALVDRAEPDECFVRIGVAPRPLPCGRRTQPKIDQTDITAGVRSGDHAYFGTTPNLLCHMAASGEPALAPFETDGLVCELGDLADARPPRVYRIDATTDAIEDLTPAGDPLLADTIGLHGAGAHRDVVLLAGPSIGPDGGLNLFAFEGSTGVMLGSTTLAEYEDLRSGVVVEDGLYLGARMAEEAAGVGGTVVKWIGDKLDPFRFETVGELGSRPGTLVEHAGRIAVGTLTGAGPGEADGEIPGIYLGPVVPDGGLDDRNTGDWERIFGVEDYEPDPVIARATSIGDLASFHGRLFFGTRQLPLHQTMSAFAAYGRPDTWWERMVVAAHSGRAAAILVMDDAGDERRDVKLLYGDDELPVFDPAQGTVVGRPNHLGQEPMFGPAGFGNHFNYAATFTVFDDRLYISTFDGSTTAPELFGALCAQEPLLDLPADVVAVFEPIVELAHEELAGGDLYRIDAPYASPVAEDLSGLGNRSNLGARVLLPFDELGKMYVGTANPFNLRSDVDEPGGFELTKLTPTAD